ncbi:DNA replication/repair protein RecF [Paenibacillus flagellatus]|uniref:DNA replication and repair protein RecF n=1 Tax=Paenibacillus flagellatus TaxID=2211139 RepID=A0A2V5JZV1_9BACL|nr:DNA replication/repair protein RecF [Paenibacillus flagellatus]PYI52378.1 DNA replication/repair protein RecF [Paenibacillus flagellatus]
MYLKKLALSEYRNYESVEFATEGAVNIFVGPNAQGKTNLLEAIFVLALTKSHRTHQDKELIRWGADRTMIRGELDKRYGPCTLDLAISNQGKKAKINGLEQKKLSGFIGALNVVLFAPEDLNIVKGSPGVRRRFLDMEIGQVQPSYLYDLSQYQKVLVQRNNLLKQSFRDSSANGAMMDVWNEQLVRLGIKIMKKRQNFIKKLQIWAESIHRGITNGSETLMIAYKPSFDYAEPVEESVLFEQFMIKLSQAKDQEIRRGTTLFGPHRDDLAFFINDKDVQTFGSQGQQRTTALSLKLAEIEFIHEEVGEYPILLLDDVLSELDTYRQTQLLETFQTKVQTFITTTGVESLQMNRLENASIFHVRNGQLVD